MNEMRELERALDACLEQMATDGIDADAALSRFPEMAADLRPTLELAAGLGGLPEIPGPTEAFRDRLAAALDAAPEPANVQVGASSQPAPTPAPTTELVRALDAALEAESGARAILDQHPQLEAELAPLVGLATALRELPATEAPAESFRGELASAIAQAPPPRATTAARGPAAGLAGGLSWLRWLWRSTAATAAVAATVIIFIAAGVTYASADALPGSPLYPVKRTSERARLLLAGDDAELALHLAFADTRLFEALSAPPFAGDALADFSREVTAALVVADGMMARGEARDEVAPPLLAWLLGARANLVDGRPALPPTAWRASLALCDEAIAALRGDATLAVAPVPRLSDPAAILARRAGAEHDYRSPLAWRSLREAAADVRERRTGPRATGADSDEPSEPAERLVYVILTSTPAPVQVAMVNGGAGASDGSEDDGAGESAPGQSEPPREPTRPPERPSAVPTTEPHRPAPSNTPFEPPVVPTETVAPPEPPTEPPTDPPTATDAPTQTAVPSADPATPTPEPTSPVTPTIPVINKQPVVNNVYCDSSLLDLYKATTCHVEAYDPEGVELQYFWEADAPQMLNERQKDATYYAAWGVGGGTMRIRITVYVSDEGEASPDGERVVSGETYIDVRSLADSGDGAGGAATDDAEGATTDDVNTRAVAGGATQ